jgi:tetratricopeptide (TPR) repeat protein
MTSRPRLTLGILGVLAVASFAQPARWLEQGNLAYESADYGTAVALYDSALARVTDARLLYNRGNAWFKQGETGRALADYLRAAVLAPNDPDIRHNIEFCRAFRADRNLVVPNPLVALLTRLLRLLDLAVVRVLTGVLFLLALAAFAWLLVTRNRAGLWLGVALGALCLYSLLSWLSWSADVSPARAVFIEPETILRSGPGEDYRDMVIVHDGLEVAVRERRGEWLLVQAPGGEGGWTRQSALERVFPE